MKQFLALGIILVLLTSCGGGGSGTTQNSGGASGNAPNIVLAVSQTNVTVNQGGTQHFVASGDAVTWSVSEGSTGGSIDSNGLYTAPNAAGTFHVVATSQSNPSVSIAVTITVPKVGITAVQAPFTMIENASLQLAGLVTVTGTVNLPVAWSVQEGAPAGTITSAGVYTSPPAPGTYHVVATSLADSTATAVITIIVEPVRMEVSPLSDVLGPFGVRPFSAVMYIMGSIISPVVTWSIKEGSSGGSMAGNIYTAPNTTGLFHVIATSALDPTAQDIAHVTVVGSGFHPTDDMQEGRSGHTATLLPSGKILIADGDGCLFSRFAYYNGSCPTTDAELFDPAAGTFTATGQTSRTHVLHTATLLNNGTVLIAGGGMGPAELYDPSSGSFSDTGAMVSSRSSHTATLLPNGKVLIAGGYSAVTGIITGTAELYDPQSGTFTATGDMTTARASHTATLLASGQVLMTGGTNQPSAELYDSTTGTFSVTDSMATARSSHSATLLNNGKVLIAGGTTDSSNSTPTAELYDPAAGTFSSTGSMMASRNNHIAVLLPSGQVLVAGSINDYTAELYDPTTGSFTQTGSMRDARALAAAVLLLDGRVLVTGGGDLNSAEIFQ